MILNFISLSSSLTNNMHIALCTPDCIALPGKDLKKKISFILLFSPNHHNCSYDHLYWSFFYNKVIFNELSVFYSDPICPCKSKTVSPFCSYAANPKKSQENCPQYRNNSRFYFPCAYMPYNNTVLAGPSLSKIIVLKILMNKYFLRTAKKATRGTFWPNSNSSAFSVSLI